MKKMMSKLTALTLAVLLMFTVSLTAAAEEYALVSPDILLDKGLESACPADGSSVTVSEANEAAATKPVGIFALKVRLGSEADSLGAFLVKNGGSQYILTHAIAATYAANGYELTLMGMDGKNHEAVCLAIDPDYELAYLAADGMTGYEPLTFSKKPFSKAVTVALSFSNSNYTAAKMLEYRTYDMGRITQLSDLYYGVTDREVTLQWLGSPVLPDKGALEVQGICSAIKDGSGTMFMGLITFEDLKLGSGYALGSAPGEEPDEPKSTEPKATEPKATEPKATEPTTPENTGIDSKYLIIGAVILAAVGYYVYNNYIKKKEKAEEPQAVEQATVPVEPMVTHNVTMPMAQWTLRCTGGPLNGQTFPVSGKVLMGRSSQADIRFPDNTPGISGTHCELVLAGDHLILRDLNSSYGTFAGGKRLNPSMDHPLYAGDTFTLAQGGPSFRLESASGSQRTIAVKSVEGKIYRSDASGKLTFGRSSANTVRFPASDSAVSGNHCVLYYEGGKLYLKDLGSTNGTFFSEKERLKPNQAYRVGKGKSFFLAKPSNYFLVIEE